MSTVIQAANRFRTPKPLTDEQVALLHINAKKMNERINKTLKILRDRRPYYEPR